MKKISSIACAFLLCALLSVVVTSCNKKSPDTNVQPSQTDNSANIAYLAKTLGIKPEEITVKDSILTAQGDMLFKADEIAKLIEAEKVAPKAKGTALGYYKYPFVVTSKTVIQVNYISGLPSDWITALNAAVSAWNNIGGIKLLFVTTVGATNTVPGAINISMYTDVSSRQASTYFPNASGNPGSNIFINSQGRNPSGNLPTASEKICILAHEIGHALGFDHVDGNGENYASTPMSVSFYCDNTPNPNSFIWYNSHSWSGFTSCDIAAIRSIYHN